MSLRIQCPGCQSPLQIGDECRGKQVRCPRCNSIMVAPGAALPPQVPVKNPSPPPAAPKPPPLPVRDAITPAKPSSAAAPRKASPPKLPPVLFPAPDLEVTKDDHPAAPAPARPARRPWIPPAVRPWLPAGAFGALLLLAVIADAVDALMSPPEGTAVAEQKINATTHKYPPNLKDNPGDDPRNVPPPPIVKLPDGPAPASIAPETTRRVMKATAYLRVTLPNGQEAQGSGFFAAEKGLVFTNAHVLGMMGAAGLLPTKVQVVLNSGEPDELTLAGEVMGVDRLTDLGVVRVKDEPGRWPAPLPVDTSEAVMQLQNVYIFGFPFGNALGKGINVTPSAVTAKRRGPDGGIYQIQVNGGMNPGNSGGPVVDSRGVVIGVAVGIVQGAGIGFAVPGEKVLSLLRGRVTDIEFGEPYRDNGVDRLPIKVQCMDPLQRIRTLKAEIWTGKPGPARPAASKSPDLQPGDRDRVVVPLTYDGTKAVGEIILPAVAPTEVVWLQPAVTDGGGTTVWAGATAFTPAEHPTLVRKTVVLQQQYDSQRERTLKLTAAMKINVNRGGVHTEEAKTIHVEALELAGRDARGGRCHVTLGSCTLTDEINGQANAGNKQIETLVRGKFLGFVTGPEGALVHRIDGPLPFINPPVARALFVQAVGRIANSYERTCVSMPNRQVKPGESWEFHMPTVLDLGGFLLPVDLLVTCTYEGSRIHRGEDQALIRLSGRIRGPGGAAGQEMGGKVAGKVHFGIAKGYVTQAAVKVEFEGNGNDGGTHTVALEVNLSRVPGNVVGLTPAAPPAEVTRGRAILQRTAFLSNRDRQDYPNKGGCYYKLYPVQLTAGKTYIIEMNRSGAPSNLDPYLVLHDPSGKKVAEDDDGGGNLNARIIYPATTTGLHQIYATSFQPQLTGSFQLTVSEATVSQVRNP